MLLGTNRCYYSLGLMENHASIGDLCPEWTYNLIIRDVEWFDIKVFRDILWNKVSKSYKNILISWNKLAGRIELEGNIDDHLKIFLDSIETYLNSHSLNDYISYDIMVRYTDNIIADREIALSSNFKHRIIDRITRLVGYNYSSCTIL